jgi:hypothetical protein
LLQLQNRAFVLDENQPKTLYDHNCYMIMITIVIRLKLPIISD